MILQEVHKKTLEHFKKLAFSSPRLEADLILAEALSWQRIDLYTKFDYPLNDKELARCRDFVGRRSKKEPLAYISEKKDFYKNTFKVKKGVLIPRADSELMVEEAVKVYTKDDAFSIVDLGCGSGCIGLSVLDFYSNAFLYAVDKSPLALEITKQNAESLSLQDRIKLMSLDLNQENLEIEDDSIKLVLCNPPYIDPKDPHVSEETKNYEPEEALYCEDEGLYCFKEWFKKAEPLVKKGGYLFFEFGWQQKNKVQEFLEGKQASFFTDIENRDRLVKSKKD